MSWSSPKRLYTSAALEFWLERLAEDWEPHFSHEAIQRGRDLYRGGLIREIHLAEGQAIVHTLEDKQPHYAVVEWENGQPRFRHSTPDRIHGHAIAVAGMYEVEELVADEVDPLPGDLDVTPSESPATNGNHEAAPAVAARPPRPLALTFSLAEDGLVFQAHWIEESGQRTPLHQSANAQLNDAEREAYIRLASRARKSGFELHARRHYRLTEPDRVAGFVQESLPQWRKRFQIDAPADLDRLARGVRHARVHLQADRDQGSARFRWTVYVDKEVIPAKVARRVLANHQRVHFLAGFGAVRLDTEQASAVTQFPQLLRDDGTGEVPLWMVFSLFGQEAIPIQLSDSLEDWKTGLLDVSTAETNLGPDFLRPYQQRGVGWMARLAKQGCHGLLADEMGLGKTLQAASLLSARPGEGLPSLIVCPASVVPVWQSELARWFPALSVDVLATGNDFVLKPGVQIWLASYTQLRRHRHLLGAVEFSYAILDEAQAIKNPDAKSAQTCCAVRARHRFALTGTPLENRPLDIWSLFRFLMPGLLGTRANFDARLKDNPEDTLRHLRRQLGPFILRRTKEEVAPELPEKIEIDLACPLTPRQRAEYTKLAEEGIREVGNDVSAALRDRTMNLLSLLTRLRQVSCDLGLLPWHRDAPIADSGKLTLLLEKLEPALESGRKVVIFSQFVSLLERLRPSLQERYPTLPLFWLTGSTLDREKPVREFQEADGAGVFLLSLKAGGTGITLHAADTVFLLDPWWNPAVENQAIDRVHRIGQDKHVVVYRLVTRGTVEERVQALKEEKRGLFDETVGNLDDVSQIARYTESLRDLIGTTDSVDLQPSA